MSIQCQACQFANEDGATACASCGAPILGGPGSRFDALFKASTRAELCTDPLPVVGPYEVAPQLTIVFQNQVVGEYELVGDVAFIGRSDDEFAPDLDLGGIDPSSVLLRRHCAVYRQNKNFTLQVSSTGAVQLNNEVLDLGDARKLSFGDVIVVGGYIGMKFEMVA